MCCGGWSFIEKGENLEDYDVCEDCGEFVDEDGDALTGCNYFFKVVGLALLRCV